jgi:glycine betaine/proline transport system substrate-binding protein
MKNLYRLGAALLAALFLAACSGPAGDTEKTANLVYVNWAEGIAYTNLAKVVLEEQLGYEVTITSADVGPAYVSVAQGEFDAFMETWLPVLHADYMERFGANLIDLGHVYENTQSGFVVPAYVTIDRIAELADHAEKIEGRIVGIDAGAGIMSTAEQVLELYDLDLELVASSGPAMTAALQEAISRDEWIVVTGWDPHWKFGRYDLKFLEQDEDKIIWEPENIHILGRLGLEEDKPELAAFLRAFSLSTEELGDLMVKVEDAGGDAETVARQWMNDHPEVVQRWLP